MVQVEFLVGYVAFCIVFLLGVGGYWIATMPFTDLRRTYGRRQP